MRFCLRCIVLLGALLAVSPRIIAAGPGDARITGHVICGDTGQPARFATVILQPLPPPNAKLDLNQLNASSSTVSGDDGAFVFDSISAGRYVIGAELPGLKIPTSPWSMRTTRSCSIPPTPIPTPTPSSSAACLRGTICCR